MRALFAAAAAAAAVLTVFACLENFNGVRCSPSSPCPSGYGCVAAACTLGAEDDFADGGQGDGDGGEDGGSCPAPDPNAVELLPLTPHLGPVPQGTVRFRWRPLPLDAGCPAVSYRVRGSATCAALSDAGCTAISAPLAFDFQLPGGGETTWTPSSGTNGRFYWQLDACGDVCASSEVRYFDYDRDPNDFRGNRTSDLIIASGWASDGGGQLFAYEGGALQLQPDSLPRPPREEALPILGGLGDTDGDGKHDLGIVLPSHKSDGGTIDQPALWRVFGGATPTLVRQAIPGAAHLNLVVGVGDVNRDGLADTVVSDGDSRSWLVYGSRSRTSPRIDQLSTPGITITYQFGAAAGDVNADGYDDVLLGGQGNSGQVYFAILLGGRNGMSYGGYRYTSTAAKQYGRVVSGIGDINDDGYDDVLAISSTNASLFTGNASVVSGSGQAWTTVTQTGVQFAGNALDEPSILLTGELADAGMPATVCRPTLSSCASGVPSTFFLTPVGKLGSVPRTAIAAWEYGAGVRLITCDPSTTACAVERTLDGGTDPTFGIGVATMPGVAR